MWSDITMEADHARRCIGKGLVRCVLLHIDVAPYQLEDLLSTIHKISKKYGYASEPLPRLRSAEFNLLPRQMTKAVTGKIAILFGNVRIIGMQGLEPIQFRPASSTATSSMSMFTDLTTFRLIGSSFNKELRPDDIIHCLNHAHTVTTVALDLYSFINARAEEDLGDWAHMMDYVGFERHYGESIANLVRKLVDLRNADDVEVTASSKIALASVKIILFSRWSNMTYYTRQLALPRGFSVDFDLC